MCIVSTVNSLKLMKKKMDENEFCYKNENISKAYCEFLKIFNNKKQIALDYISIIQQQKEFAKNLLRI